MRETRGMPMPLGMFVSAPRLRKNRIHFAKKTLRTTDTIMRDEPSDEADDSRALLARNKMRNRRLWVVILSAALTWVACKFLAMRFASAEQVMLTLLSIAMIALLLRIFRSKGRFRFASLLLLTAFCSVVFRVVLQPLKRLSAQNAAMELLNRKGGSMVTYAGMERYPQNAHGWVQSDSGYLYPALLAYLEKKYLHPVDVMSLKIPSSLINKELWNSLHCNQVNRVEVLLDGSENGKEFNQILSGIPHFFVEWDHYFFHRLVFVADKPLDGTYAIHQDRVETVNCTEVMKFASIS